MKQENRMKTVIYSLILLALLTASAVAETGNSIKFDPQLILIDRAFQSVTYSAFPTIVTPSGREISARTVYVELKGQESTSDITFRVLNRTVIELSDQPDPLSQLTTSEDGLYSEFEEELAADLSLGTFPVKVDGEKTIENRRYAKLLIFPVTFSSDGDAFLNTDIQIRLADRIIVAEELIDPKQLPASENYESNRSRSMATSSATMKYLIVTSRSLAESFERLAQYKTSLGLPAKVAMIDNILSAWSGRDDAEKLRNYLKQSYVDGAEYILLAGDETILPIRYASHRSVSEMPPMELLQVCDLYFADLTGQWDLDNDGIWGESMHDRPDLTPELRVGRLPFNSVKEADNYVNKLIRYETGTGSTDLTYLNRAFFFSSDQMRDYGQEGQHAIIAKAYPNQFVIDTVNGVENSSGADPNPTNPPATSLTSVLSDGYGIVNIIAHGRSDAFAVRTSGYNNWPKSYFLTDAGGSAHGTFDSLKANGRTSFYYSLACDNGGFDLDQPPISHTNANLVQTLLGLKDAGAVAFVAYSRWGWTGSSHLLQKAFFDSLFAHPDRPAIDAMNASKADFSYYRDLNYGQNFYGDPSLKVFTAVPQKLAIEVVASESKVTARVTVDGQPVEGCTVILSEPGLLVAEGTTDTEGRVEFSQSYTNDQNFTLTAVKTGATVAMQINGESIVTGTEEETTVLPEEFLLAQNYPNPFNPTTTISFDLTRNAYVEISIHNLLGQTVSIVADGNFVAGEHDVIWEGNNNSGEPVASGIYFYRMRSGQLAVTRKMVLLR